MIILNDLKSVWNPISGQRSCGRKIDTQLNNKMLLEYLIHGERKIAQIY